MFKKSLFLLLFVLLGCSKVDKTSFYRIETSPVPGNADECAIWVNPNDSSLSTVIGNDKKEDGALYVWDMKGKLLFQTEKLNKPVGVDLRYGMNLSEKHVDIVVCGLRSTNELKVFKIDPDLRKLIDITSLNRIFTGFPDSTYGISLYKRPKDGKIFAFVSCKKTENIHQIELFDDTQGGVGGKLVRSFGKEDQKSFVEGMCADDVRGFFYCSDETHAILKYRADPDENNNNLVGKFALKDGIKGDREGLALYKKEDGTGYLVVSSQGNSTFKIYQREGNNLFLKTVKIKNVKKPDGIEITSLPILPDFPTGLFVCHNDKYTNFALIDWTEFSGLR
jgi:3-phytase